MTDSPGAPEGLNNWRGQWLKTIEFREIFSSGEYFYFSADHKFQMKNGNSIITWWGRFPMFSYVPAHVQASQKSRLSRLCLHLGFYVIHKLVYKLVYGTVLYVNQG